MLDIESMFNFIFVFRIQFDPGANNSFCKENALSIYLRRWVKYKNRFESTPDVLLVIVPSIFQHKKIEASSALLTHFCVRPSYIYICIYILPILFCRETQGFLRGKKQNIFFSSSVTCSIFTILVILFSSSIMPIFERDNRYGKNRKLDCIKLFKINVRLQIHNYS